MTNVAKRRLLLIGMAALLFGLFLIGFFPRLYQTHKNVRLAEKVTKPQVSVMIAKAQETPISVKLPSVTQANHVTPIWARADGYLTELRVDIGDLVKEGQLLAVLATPEVDEQYAQAVGEYESAKVSRDLAKLNADRAELAYSLDPGSISKLDHDTFISTYKASQANVSAAEANMMHYKDLMDFKYIKAPFDGIIIERDVDLGSLVSAGSNGSPQQLFVIALTDIIRVFVSVPQIFFRSIKEGVEGITNIREFGNRGFKSVVARYAKALDPVAHTMLTELHIDNSNGDLVPGLYAEVNFSIKPDLPYFIVPTPAVIIRAGDPHIAVLDEHDVVHLITVKIGLDYGKSMEIVDGIQPNDRIVINPTERVREGVECEVVEVQQNEKYFFPQIY